ncbi:Glyoxylase, beta-lactamase superfamily II [Thalassobacillus cyri]|uniref:Glyoxylase, beta-lactamase superfamily II n=1 Tax=Thalassobacillus cyri TaxID=571932 RepID=A0A1H4CDY7_9BACI|nr:MBL fold metallo-hydrolase [Thalassobacillus cyri]SEA58675.1 Glyoxylase, beta-lactamase superfamily II [Thalassobacillus cyri]
MNIVKQKIQQITVPTPYAVGDVHVYIINGDQLSIIDAGVKTDEAWEAFVFQLKQLGYGPEDIEQVILTHHHPDHIGFIEYFPRLNEVTAHPQVDSWLKREPGFLQNYQSFFHSLYQQAGVPERYLSFLKELRNPLGDVAKGNLTSTILEGDLLPGHEEWRVIATPGHAQSHLSFYREQDGALLGGDHLLEHISPNPLLEPPHNNSKERPMPMLQYRNSLKKLLHYDINHVYPGHGKIFSHVHDLIDRRLESQEKRAAKVQEIIGKDEMTTFEICARLFPKQFEKQFGLTMSETIGQLDYLTDIHAVGTRIDNGVTFYKNMEDS